MENRVWSIHFYEVLVARTDEEALVDAGLCRLKGFPERWRL